MIRSVAVAILLMPGLAEAAGVDTGGSGQTLRDAPVRPTPTRDEGWDGAYLGAQVGFAGMGDDRVAVTPPGSDIGELDNQGGFFRLHIGRNWRRGRLLLGIEGEASVGGIGDSFDSGGYNASTELLSEVGIRLRLGLPRDEVIPYISVGVSSARFDYSVVGNGATIDQRIDMVGKSVGLGWERWMNESWSWRVELRYSEYGSETLSDGANSTVATPVMTSIQFGLSRSF